MTDTETQQGTSTSSAERLYRVHLRGGTTVAIRARDEIAMQKLAGRAVKSFNEVTRDEIRTRFGMSSGYHARRAERIYQFLLRECALPEMARIEKHSSPQWGRGKRAACIAATNGRVVNGRAYKSARLWIVL